MKKIHYVLVMSCWLATVIFAQVQAQSRAKGTLLVQLLPETSKLDFLSTINKAFPTTQATLQPVAVDWSIYKVSFIEDALADPTEFLSEIGQIPSVRHAQWNHLVEERGIEPNDPFWEDQPDMRVIGLPEAWENTTGGYTLKDNHRIVVAVLEKGMNKEHPQILPTLWKNSGEIADNNIDDDNNGYKDDYYGWDAQLGYGDGNGNGSSHGTSVHAIIGAKGNDETGVTGVNWDVDLMSLVNVKEEVHIIAAYNYVFKQRDLYNKTNGQKGAFVVATNASFGINNAKAEDYPLWCEVYDQLGGVGILSAGATTNSNTNVEVQGDMPTTCTSEFLMTVTNIDALNGKRVNSGYGKVSIDLGSPGQGTFTAVNASLQGNNTIYESTFGGTSASCPHLSGAIALVYSVQCSDFVADALTDPMRCARRVRDAIVNNLIPEPTLTEFTATGGRLSVANTIEDIMELCSGTTGPLELLDIRPNPIRQELLQVRFQTPNYEPYQFEFVNALGQVIYFEEYLPRESEPKIREFSLSHLPTGVYVLRIRQGKNFDAKKILKI
jgi:Subtilase family/Secretion system C-terminal sorting domain